MSWFHDNFWKLFDGLGASLVAALVGWFLVYFFSRSQPSSTTVRDSSMNNSAVALGDGNTQTPIQIHGARDVHIGHAPPVVPVAPVPSTKPERPAYNINFIDAGVFSLDEGVGGGFLERGSKQNAIGIRFANEPITGGENRTVSIKAVLIFRDEEGKEILDISGAWLNSDRF